MSGFLFWLFRSDFGLGELKVMFDDLIAAFVGSLSCMVVWWLVSERTTLKSRSEP